MNTKSIIFDECKMGKFMNDRDDYKDFEEHTKKYNYTTQQKVAYAMWLKYCIYDNLPEEKIDEAVRKILVKFCKEKDSGFDEDVNYNQIKAIMKAINKRTIWKDQVVYISQNEWNQICSLDNENARRFYFVCLVIAKFYREVNRDNMTKMKDTRYKIGTSSKVIAKYARVNIPGESEYLQIWKQLDNAGLTEPHRYYNKGKLQVKPILLQADVDVKPEDSVLDVKPCDTMILYYIDKFQGEFPDKVSKDKKIQRCKECGEPYDERVSSQYCRMCDATRNREIKHIPCKGGCGKILELEGKSRTEYCSECKKKKNNERQPHKGWQVKICEVCGVEFEANPKTLLCLCNDCKINYQKERNKIKNKNWRDRSNYKTQNTK